MEPQSKKRTTVYLMPEVVEFCKTNKINFSAWAEKEFYEKFLGINSKVEELKALEQQKTKLLKEIEEIKARRLDLSKSLTDNERRFIYSVKPMTGQGYQIIALKNRFNFENHRALTLDEFRALVDLYEDQAQKRLEYAIDRKHKKGRK